MINSTETQEYVRNFELALASDILPMLEEEGHQVFDIMYSFEEFDIPREYEPAVCSGLVEAGWEISFCNDCESLHFQASKIIEI